MTTFRALILSLALPLIFSISHSHGSETVKVNKAFNGREIKVRSGATIQLELEQAGATGYTWEIQNPDSEHFEILGVRTGDRPNNGETVGAPVMKTWNILAKKVGKSTLKLLYYKPWEGGKSAVDTFVLNIRILGAKP